MTGSISGADLAEWYDTEPDVEIGDTVAIGNHTLTYTAGSLGKQDISVLKKAEAGDQLVGVVSSVPSKLMGFDITKYAQHPQPIALSGRVPVKVTSLNGPIKSGDLLAASSIPGVAMRATKAGQTVGSALEDYDGPPEEIGEVLALVNTAYSAGARTRTILEQHGVQYSEEEWRKPGIDIGRLALADMLGEKDKLLANPLVLSEMSTDRLAAGLEVITPRVLADTVAVNYLEPALNNDIVLRLDPDKDGKFIIGQGEATTLDTLGAEVKPVITFDAEGNAIFAGTVTAAGFEIRKDSGLEVLEDKVTELSERVNAVSASQIPVWPDSSPTPDLPAGQAEATPGLTADTSPTPMPTITPDLFQTAGKELDVMTLSQLLMSDALVVNGSAEFNGKTIFNGSTEFTKAPVFNQDTAGSAVVKEGSREVTVTFAEEYASVPLINADLTFDEVRLPDGTVEDPTAREERILTSGYNYLVSRRTTKGFTIVLNKLAQEQLTFSWMAVGVKDPKTFTSTEEATVAPTPTPAPAIIPSATPEPTPEPVVAESGWVSGEYVTPSTSSE